MKKLVFIFLSYLITQKLNAQAFSVGNTFSCVTAFVGKTFSPIASGPCFGCTLATDSYSFAVTGSPLTNITVTSYTYNQPLGSSSCYKKELYISSNNNVEFAYMSSCGVAGNICKNLASGSSLQAPTISWTANTSRIYGTYAGGCIMGSYTCGVQANPFFLGFRKILTNDTIYGWISINSNWPGGVNSYAFKHTSPSTVTPVFTTTTTSLCSGNTLTLDATPQGGLFNGTWVSGNAFTSNTSGFYTINYSVGCGNTAYLNINVSGPNTIITNTQSTICKDDTIILYGSPAGGTFSGPSVLGNTFIPISYGSYTVSYTCLDSNGCGKTYNKLFYSTSCVGIYELNAQASAVKIFPNPNNGEFEVKGEKESSLIVTNELGQIVKKIELNAANNFSSKMTELQSGVYFVGNNYLRQKIVVIK